MLINNEYKPFITEQSHRTIVEQKKFVPFIVCSVCDFVPWFVP
nr:MAG TPA: hypothetical protein [Caudoviricetes sp.]DAX60980.1 MAG TPA: hypothetical protein [Caudoviricetes sp.]